MAGQAAVWDDASQALDFMARRWEDWFSQNKISSDQLATARNACDDWRQKLEESRERGLPFQLEGLAGPKPNEPPAARSLRYWRSLAEFVRLAQDRGMLPMATGHALLDEIAGHCDALARRLSPAERPTTPNVPPPLPPRYYLPPLPEVRLAPEAPALPRRPLLEALLDPRNIQYLLVFGGALMVLGLVILLYVNDFFTPPLVATGLAVLNAVALALGWWLMKGTAYQVAGRAVTLLACAIMPLNLWYVQANGLLTVEGNLWMAATLACLLYAASAWVLQDEAFVHVLVGGLAATGLLVIAKWPPTPSHFWGIAAPATLLVSLGLVCIHAEFAFPDEPVGAFTRRRFGLAFFWSGHAALAGGLLLLLGAFVSGSWFYPLFEPHYLSHDAVPSDIVQVGKLHGLALLLVLAGAYAYVYSDLVVRHVGYYIIAAAAMLVWATVLIVEELHIRLGVEMFIALMAGLGLAVNLAQATALNRNRYTRVLPVLGLLLPLLALITGLQVFRQHLTPFTGDQMSPEGMTWGYVLAMALTAASWRMGAHIYRDSARALADLFFIGTAAATLAGAAALLAVLGLRGWQGTAHLLMLIPIAYLVAAHAYMEGPSTTALVKAGHLAAALVLLIGLEGAILRSESGAWKSDSLLLALLFLEGMIFYALASRLHGQSRSAYVAAALGCGVLWQLTIYVGLHPEFYALVLATAGLVLLAGYRAGAFSAAGTQAAFQAGNILLSIAFIANTMLSLSRLALDQALPLYAGLCLILTVAALIALGLVRERNWRRWYVVACIGQALLAFLVLTLGSGLSLAQKWQIFATLAGVVLLVASQIGLAREGERQDDLVGVGLFLGSCLLAAPQILISIDGRIGGQVTWYNEAGFLAAGLLLMTSGFVQQLRSTTLIGAATTALYVATLLLFVPWTQMTTMALMLLLGGGGLFGLGLVLSVFRERLLTLPDRIRNREGVFRVLSWR